MVGVLEVLLIPGHPLPRIEASRTLRQTSEAFAGSGAQLDRVLERYSARKVAAMHVAPRVTRSDRRVIVT